MAYINRVKMSYYLKFTKRFVHLLRIDAKIYQIIPKFTKMITLIYLIMLSHFVLMEAVLVLIFLILF